MTKTQHTHPTPPSRLHTSIGSLMVSARADGTYVAHTVNETAHLDGVDSLASLGHLRLQVSVHFDMNSGVVHIIAARASEPGRATSEHLSQEAARAVAAALAAHQAH